MTVEEVPDSLITGEKMEMDIVHCFLFFPQFLDDFQIFINNGIIKHIDFDRLEWTYSKTSLAEYFKWIGCVSINMPGGFWASVEKVFKVNRKSLSRLAGNNANELKPDESKDFKKIKELVERHREQVRQQLEQT